MNAFYTDLFVLPLPQGHRFPMEKYTLLRQRVESAGFIAPANMCIPHHVDNEQLALAHNYDYILAVQNGYLSRREIRKIGFPWSPGMVERSRRSVGATIEASYAALQHGTAVNLAGGTHHAHWDSGGGYCVFNDVTIAARVLQHAKAIQRAVIIDADVHQGDGTAAILADDPTIFTFSIHGAKNYPFHKPPSDLDIGLPDDTQDRDYLAALREGVDYALEKAAADIAIYLAGADPYAGDSLGRLGLSKWGLKKRDEIVLEKCFAKGIPVAITMAGGYAKRVADTVDIHFNTVKLAAEMHLTLPR